GDSGSSSVTTAIDQDPNWALYKDVVVDPAHGSDPEATVPLESKGFDLNVDKAVVDSTNQTVTYTVRLVNDGNVAVAKTGITLTDSFEGGAPVDLTALPFSGDTNPNAGDQAGYLDPGETWVWTYTHPVTQTDLDSNGNPNGTDAVADGTLENVVSASATGFA